MAPDAAFGPTTLADLDIVYGDSDGTIGNTAAAQTFVYSAGATSGFGDADIIDGAGRGGDDVFTVTGTSAAADNLVIGDANGLNDSAQGGDDRITVRAYGVGYGDAEAKANSARGGDDVLFGAGRNVLLSGDGRNIDVDAAGGNDRLVSCGSGSRLYGDASRFLFGHGGDDFLRTTVGQTQLVGDGDAMTDTAVGGNDLLQGSRFADTIIGDGRLMDVGAKAGDDVLVGGRGNDTLYGDGQVFAFDEDDAGADRFVFSRGGGKDTIGDFQQGHDLIDVQSLGYTGIGELTIDEADGNSIVHFFNNNQVTVVGVTGLTETDFLFA